ncbi:TlpA family protein disulfide reductase [Nonlabens agnitus]|uniref:Thioredoxin domain-containing protein n=1 Tax=Nonlabens agnitus TaxID=870484 RepID=A0A2S9WW10_9FLAO|nr:TlpA disulfide reductase family protein [Nonlabens agnitus]PRP67659.1 hypothetical protein BST86_11445 [Nonlabens agnitus]
MKNLLFLTLLALMVSCKEGPQKPLRYADVDTSSKDVLHLTDPDDYYYSLEDLIEASQGKVVYVNFWASYEFGFKESMRALEKLEKEMPKENFKIINICLDAVMLPFEQHLRITTLEHNYIARGFEDSNFAEEYDFVALPRFMLYDRKGKLIDNNAMAPTNENLESTLQLLIEQ